jgi:hypothetical protein
MCEIIDIGASDQTCLKRCDRVSDMCFECRVAEAKLWTKPY